MTPVRLLPIAAVVAALVASPAAAQPLPQRDALTEAVDRGLAFLARSQNPDGSWSSAAAPFGAFPRGAGRAAGNGDLALTALSVMAFLSAGHVPGEGPYRDAVDRGVRYVTANQAHSGLFAAPFGGQTEMYYHGICTLMLAEVVGMTDAALADGLRDRLRAAVRVILDAQRKSGPDAGGWRYRVAGNDADLSVTGWQMMALRAAKNVGCDVPADRIRAAVEYVRRCHDPRSGGYRYTAPHGNVTVPCTGTGILALELCGKDFHATPEAVRAASYLLKHPMTASAPHFYYGVYYTSQSMFQMGDALGTNYWASYREHLHRLLLADHPQDENGAWGGRGADARYGPAYGTSMAILALTVEYRLLPIYQRFEEPAERDGTER